MELKTLTARTLAGPVIPSPVVTVRLPGTSDVASGLNDLYGAPLSNPFTGTEDGLIAFSAPDGDYDVNVTGGGRNYTERVRCGSGFTGAGAPVKIEPGAALMALPEAAGRYTVFTSPTAKNYSFDSAHSYAIGDEYHVRNAGLGDLVLTAVGTFVFNPPSGGSLVIPQGGTASIKIVATNQADVCGVTDNGAGIGLASIVAGSGVLIDNTDPANPVLSIDDSGGVGGLSFSQGQTAAGVVLTNADRTASTQPYLSGFRLARSQSFKSSGSWYFEIRCVSIASATSSVIGLSGPNYPHVSNSSAEALPGYSFCRANGQIFYNNGSSSPTGLAFASGDVVGIMLNADAGWMKIVKNGVPSSDGPIIGGGAWAPCVGFDAGASSGSFEILAEPVHAIPAGFTYWT